jgi:hypothetical protein
MGACSFQNSGRGKSAQQVFTRLQENAEREYGDDCYNGTISTVPGFRDITNEWKNSKKDLNRFIDEKLDNANKYDCFAICTHPPVENKNKTKTQVENIVTPGTKKWVLLYCVYEAWSDRFVASFNNKGDAVKRARELAEKNMAEVHVKMEKKLDKGTPLTAKITYKKSTTEKDGEWIFFGYAAE